MDFDPPTNPVRRCIISTSQRRLNSRHGTRTVILFTDLQSPCPFHFILRFLMGREVREAYFDGLHFPAITSLSTMLSHAAFPWGFTIDGLGYLA